MSGSLSTVMTGGPLFDALTRSERVIIVEDDRVRSVVIGPRQRLRPALYVAAALAGMLFCLAGWLVAALSLSDARQAIGFLGGGSESLAAQLAEARGQLAAMAGEMEEAQLALAAALAEERAVRDRVAQALSTLEDGEEKAAGKDGTKTLRTALADAREVLAPLQLGPAEGGSHLQAAERSLAAVGQASQAFAARRAQAALAAVDMAAEQPLDSGEAPDGQAPGLARALAEARGEAARLRAETAAAQEERDRMAAQVVAADQRIAKAAEGQVALLSRLTEHADLRIGALEGALRETGVNIDSVLKELEKERFGMGGPLVSLPEMPPSLMPPEATAALAALETRLARQERLKALTTLLPLSTPVDDFYVTSGFGNRRDPFTRQWAMHTGIDLVAPIGTPVSATAAGKVLEVGWEDGYGRQVLVDHGFGIRTRYGHLEKAMVREGDTVSLGQQVGTLGNSGRSSGPHVHYEVIVDGRPVDPLRFMERGRHVCQG